MGENIKFTGNIQDKRQDQKGNINEFNKKFQRAVDTEYLDNQRIAIDANMMTSAIMNEDFKRNLIVNNVEDMIFTTILCKKESIGNLTSKMRISYSEAKNRFERFEREIGLRYLEYEEDYYYEGIELFDKIKKLGMVIKDERTFKKDCINVAIIIKNGIKIFFSNDEELEKACKIAGINLEFIRIADSQRKIIKDFFRPFKSRYRWKRRRAWK